MDVVARGGWRPRIDFPTSKKKTFYYREKRAVRKVDGKDVFSDYGAHYVSVAKKVLASPLFEDIPTSWGVRQIRSASVGSPPSKAPSFWISVRMEIHLLQQIARLGK